MSMPILTPEDDGVDYTPAEKEMFLSFVRQNIRRRPPGARQYVRFLGRPDPHALKPCSTKKMLLYRMKLFFGLFAHWSFVLLLLYIF